MHLRTLAIADSAGDVVQLAMMRACTEVQLATGNLGSEDGAGIQAVAVVAAADTADVVGEHTGVQLEIALRQGCRDADAALEGECVGEGGARSEEHTSELQSLMRISYAVFCLKNKTIKLNHNKNRQ